jgi:hypothetical protein
MTDVPTNPSAVPLHEILKLVRDDSFVLKVLMSKLDTYTFKLFEYDKRAARVRASEEALRERMVEQSRQFKSLPKDVRLEGSADQAQMGQLKALLSEKVVYETLTKLIRKEFDSMVTNATALRDLRTADLRDETMLARIAASLDPAAVVRQRDQIVEAISLVEDGIQGEARRSIRESLYSILKTFARNPRGLLNSLAFNFLLLGSPGTGKSSAAESMARFFHLVGILVTDQVHVLNKTNLVAGYLGQSAAKTRATIYGALEGVAFLDEAYSLLSCEYREGGDPSSPVTKRDAYGMESIDQVTDMLTDLKGLLCFIAAGYDREMMNCFLASNSGLDRRFATKWVLTNFSAADLIQILVAQLERIDASTLFWFQKRQMFHVERKGESAADLVHSISPLLIALNKVGAFTFQAGDMDSFAHALYNLLAISEGAVGLSKIIELFNTFFRITKREPHLRLVSLSAAGDEVRLVDRSGKRRTVRVDVIAARGIANIRSAAAPSRPNGIPPRGFLEKSNTRSSSRLKKRRAQRKIHNKGKERPPRKLHLPQLDH